MRTDRTSAAEADRLNQIWDSLVDDEVPVSETATPDSTTDRQRETLILYLESLLPSPSHLEKMRLNAHVEQLMREDHRMNTAELAPSASPPRKATEVQANWRTRFVPVIRTFDRIAAAGLILAVVAALVLLVPVRGLLDGNEPSRFAAMLGFDENESTEQNVGSQSTITLDIRPGDYEGGTVEVGFWEVTLAPGSAMFAPTSGDPISEPFGFSVSQESVLFGGDATWRLVEEGGSVGDLAGIDSVRNPNTSPAHMLVLAPMPPNAGFPLTIGAWSPGDAAASPIDGAAESETDPVLLSSVELDDSAAFQYRVLVSENILAPGMGIGDVESFGPPSSTLHAITVREGQLAVAPDESLSTPEVTQDLVPGDTVQLEAVGVWDSDMRVIGWESAIVLGLLTMPAAENHTLDQTLESIAPFWGEWTVPASGEVNLVVRRLALAPGATYNLPTGAGVLYHVASGSVDVQNSDSGNTVNVAPGGTVAQISGTVLELSSSESGRAEVIQTLIFDGPLDIITERESLEGVAIETLVTETDTLPPGQASLMLEVYEYNGENGGGASGEGGQGLALITSVDGVIEVSRNGGNAELIPALGEFSVQAPLGEGIEIEPGGYLLAQPGSGWSITGGTGAPSTGLVLTVSSILGPDATPVPTAAPGTIGTVSLFGEARSCDIVPLTNSDIATALATPASSESPLDRSMRDADGDPADRLTFDAVVYRLQEYADCVAAGDYARTYAFYSDQAIRESDVIQDLVRSGHRVEAGPSARLSLENLQVFPDGRAGARAVIDGEAAYLTFVYEDGRWKIDVWDDSVGGRVPIVTPAS